MTSARQTRLACYCCNEYLVGKRDDDSVKNCFGYSYGPRENPFLHPKHQKKWYKVPTDSAGLQPILLKCGHIFHKACLKTLIMRENGSFSRTGNCPICQKTFILGKTIDIHLKISESDKIARKRQLQFDANEQKRLGIRAEIEYLQRLNDIYQRGFDKTRQTIVADARLMLLRIRQIRQRKRLLDRFQLIHLDPLEKALDDIYDESRVWKQLLGKPVKLDSAGNYVATPHAPCQSYISCTATEDELPFSPIPAGAKPSSPSPLEFLRRLTSPLGPGGDPRLPRHDADHDYSRYWELLPTPVSSEHKAASNRRSSPLYQPYMSATPDSEPDYDIAAFSSKMRARIEKEVKAKKKWKATRNTQSKDGHPMPSFDDAYRGTERNSTHSEGFAHTFSPEESCGESGTEIGSDYKMDATSIVGSAELGKRCDVRIILDPERALSKWRHLLGVTLKFDYKYANELIDWELEYPRYINISANSERFMFQFIDQNWKELSQENECLQNGDLD